MYGIIDKVRMSKFLHQYFFQNFVNNISSIMTTKLNESEKYVLKTLPFFK